MPRGRSKGYSNRTDLQAGKPMAVSAPTGMPYGDNKALRDAQRAVPMGSPSAPTPPKNAPETPSAPSTGPLTAVPLTAPTQRPNESIMSGLSNPNTADDIQTMKNTYLSYFEDALASPSVPQQFANFVSWLRAQ